MTDLREKIVGCLRAWTEDTIEDIDAHGEVCCAESAEDLSDRILALLPKMPEFRWKIYVGMDNHIIAKVRCYLGSVWVGYTTKYIGGNTWDAWAHSTDQLHWCAGEYTSEAEARAAVEAAVRKALGWVE